MALIGVYADWEGLDGPERIGYLHSRRTRTREIFEFEYDKKALADPSLNFIQLDPEIMLYEGAQYPIPPKDKFGAFSDSCPDRWGRMLMKRRFERDIRDGLCDKDSHLYESDYLLGVHDLYRVGALRYKREDAGEFLDNRIDVAAPPFTEIASLERASRAIEEDPDNKELMGQKWLRMVVNALAVGCGLNVAPAQAHKFASNYHCFMVRRFDRTNAGRRLHFASAMTLTRHQDGEDASTGVSYLELADVLIRHGAQTNTDLKELWSRIVFNILVSNTDDHLRNHGYILIPGKGWRLSEAYDLNPVARSDGLKLNITENDNALDLELAREVAEYFRLGLTEADDIIANFRGIVSQWRIIAERLRLPGREQELMAEAFRGAI